MGFASNWKTVRGHTGGAAMHAHKSSWIVSASSQDGVALPASSGSDTTCCFAANVFAKV